MITLRRRWRLRQKKENNVKNGALGIDGEIGVCNDGIKLSRTKNRIGLKAPETISSQVCDFSITQEHISKFSPRTKSLKHPLHMKFFIFIFFQDLLS